LGIHENVRFSDFRIISFNNRLSNHHRLEENIGGQPCYLLELLPKRKAKNLLQGKIWVDKNTYLPQRIEGEPVKPPSWWLRRLRIELSYGEVGGMWLQTALEATAIVRVLGPYTMVSHDVKYQLSDLVVAARPNPERMPNGCLPRSRGKAATYQLSSPGPGLCTRARS
jgi:hypothetical protein